MGELFMAVNYTEEQVDFMINQYNETPTRETVERLADELNKSIKSIIGKLSREGVYKKTEYLTKTGEKPITKRELVENIADKLELDVTALAGLEKSPKLALKKLEEKVNAIVN
jgi:Zn-dependent M32 family carboxypeptidase